jgi:PadR family transcriptional regulator PadR
MQLENTKAQLRKGVLELCILSILANERKYASEILSHLKDAKLIVVEGTLYPLLTRLRSANLFDLRMGGVKDWTAEKVLFHYRRW